jgi:hypothetical protein
MLLPLSADGIGFVKGTDAPYAHPYYLNMLYGQGG